MKCRQVAFVRSRLPGPAGYSRPNCGGLLAPPAHKEELVQQVLQEPLDPRENQGGQDRLAPRVPREKLVPPAPLDRLALTGVQALRERMVLPDLPVHRGRLAPPAPLDRLALTDVQALRERMVPPDLPGRGGRLVQQVPLVPEGRLVQQVPLVPKGGLALPGLLVPRAQSVPLGQQDPRGKRVPLAQLAPREYRVAWAHRGRLDPQALRGRFHRTALPPSSIPSIP